mmetsp:Transcript_69514/g.193404  ORF Transcript_69514/g.193404 Transcript_69514/m.193404 type:complete len:227 (-) Transcript_69514:305-985(-)
MESNNSNAFPGRLHNAHARMAAVSAIMSRCRRLRCMSSKTAMALCGCEHATHAAIAVLHAKMLASTRQRLSCSNKIKAVAQFLQFSHALMTAPYVTSLGPTAKPCKASAASQWPGTACRPMAALYVTRVHSMLRSRSTPKMPKPFSHSPALPHALTATLCVTASGLCPRAPRRSITAAHLPSFSKALAAALRVIMSGSKCDVRIDPNISSALSHWPLLSHALIAVL